MRDSGLNDFLDGAVEDRAQSSCSEDRRIDKAQN